ncbi:hypothetical protein FIBSPDRAFT_1041021 [Athelia psychrophila]|uniref:DUF6534 domain-containing protein n=1 Tax=Athelia psychrophila TaxID=1759441 RepID=A0A166PBF8_9AGAM|nr:hypothetical protein FIBSPDRAFT_1041021 [Fibularhizoctonia sp. CBS 109695]
MSEVNEIHVTATMGDIEASIGHAFIGFVISLSLFGVSIAQTAFYGYHFRRDGMFKKSSVVVLNIVDVLQTAVLADMFWEMLVDHNLPSAGSRVLNELPWQIAVFIFTSIFMNCFVQGFFCQRVWRVSGGNVILLSIITTSSLMTLIVGIVGTTQSAVPPFRINLGPFVHMHFLTLILADGTISGSLIYHFNSSRLGMPRSEPVMRQLIWLSMNTGLMLCLVTTVNYYLATNYSSASYLAPTFILSKLHLNSMMAALNTRRHFRAVFSRTMTDDINFTAALASRVATD